MPELPLLAHREVVQFNASLSPVLNGRPVEISRGFAISQLGSTVGKALQSPMPPPGIWVRFSCSISAWFVLSHNMAEVNTKSDLASLAPSQNRANSGFSA